MNANAETRKLTVAEFHQMAFDDADTHQYELLDGDLVKRKPPPRNTNLFWQSYMTRSKLLSNKLS
ncbi:hypothetical protein GCM10023187_00250 [Nibrella viscosa]|uniref:Restriction endonuclease domain-containing protein n=1 Tax=Nibrella viscosa TaxID=1084524 RepID=A0ABP8JQE0_9BACT